MRWMRSSLLICLGSERRAAKFSVSRTVSEPTSASSCSTYADMRRKVFGLAGEPLM